MDGRHMIQATIYVDPATWEALRLLGLPHKASASAQCVVLAQDYLAASERRQRDVLRRAAEMGRGKSSRARE